jgi:hypothetical protein
LIQTSNFTSTISTGYTSSQTSSVDGTVQLYIKDFYFPVASDTALYQYHSTHNKVLSKGAVGIYTLKLSFGAEYPNTARDAALSDTVVDKSIYNDGPDLYCYQIDSSPYIGFHRLAPMIEFRGIKFKDIIDNYYRLNKSKWTLSLNLSGIIFTI